MKFLKLMALRLLPFLQPLAVRLVIAELSRRQAKLDPKDREDAITRDVLDYLKDRLAAL